MGRAMRAINMVASTIDELKSLPQDTILNSKSALAYAYIVYDLREDGFTSEALDVLLEKLEQAGEEHYVRDIKHFVEDFTTKYRRHVVVTNIYVSFYTQPNDDIYTPEYPTELLLEDMWVFSPTQLLDLYDVVYDEMYDNITFDTPDDPYFEIDDITFDIEVLPKNYVPITLIKIY